MKRIFKGYSLKTFYGFIHENILGCHFGLGKISYVIGHFLTHWGRVTHICVGNLTIIGSDNGLSPGRRQAITWTNVEILLIGPLGTNFSEMLIEIHTFSFKKIQLKMLSGKWWPFCLSLNVLMASFKAPQWYYGYNHRNIEENMSKFSVKAVAADGLAPLGARTSAGTVMYSLHPACIWAWHLKDLKDIYL